jgi:hypothetical protein
VLQIISGMQKTKEVGNAERSQLEIVDACNVYLVGDPVTVHIKR